MSLNRDYSKIFEAINERKFNDSSITKVNKVL